MAEFTHEEVVKKISDLMSEAQDLIWEAERLADEHAVGFRMDFGEYGMGGWYEPAPDDGGSWQASSSSC